MYGSTDEQKIIWKVVSWKFHFEYKIFKVINTFVDTIPQTVEFIPLGTSCSGVSGWFHCNTLTKESSLVHRTRSTSSTSKFQDRIISTEVLITF